MTTITTTNRRRRLRTLAAAAIGAGALALPLPSALADGCHVTQSFAAWGDSNNYTLTDNGSFETGGGWGFTGGAQIVLGSDDLNISLAKIKSTKDTHSLLLPPGATATTSVPCQRRLQPPIRFAVENTGSPSAMLQVSAFTGDENAPVLTPIGTVTAGPSWSVSPPLSFVVPSGALGFQFTAIGAGGAFHIDDVLVDPFKGR
jgi:hypothetical protein